MVSKFEPFLIITKLQLKSEWFDYYKRWFKVYIPDSPLYAPTLYLYSRKR